MDKNFWTEENRIMNYDNLFRADLQSKLLRMSNQIVTSKDIPDLCYNYDYFINQKDKAVQFISDYAEEFVNNLNRYHQTTGEHFVGMQNPLKMASLMALYAARDIIGSSEYMRERGENKFVLNNNNLDIILKDINGPDKQISPRLIDKVLTSKEDLTQACLEYVRDALMKAHEGKGDISLKEALSDMPRPELTEQLSKTLLKNSYEEIAAVVLSTPDIDTTDIKSLICDIVYKVSQEMVRDRFELDSKDFPLDKEFLVDFCKMVDDHQIHPKINFNPIPETEERAIVNEKAHRNESARYEAREK